MTDQKPTGVFVRLPLSDEQVKRLEYRLEGYNSALLAIGTPVTGGELEVVAYTSPEDIRRIRKGKSGDIYGSQKWEGSDDCVFTIPLVRQSDILAKLAEKDAEIARYREALSKISSVVKDKKYTETYSALKFCETEAQEALKGPEA